MPAHGKELERRYLGIDYVAEFQRHWSYLNQWLRTKFAGSTDRDLVENFKSDVRCESALQDALALGHNSTLVNRMSGPGKWVGDLDMYRFFTDTVGSTFVEACFSTPAVATKLNLCGPAPVDRVRGTATTYLDENKFVDLYRSVVAQGDNFMSEEMMSVREALSVRGIDFAGRTFTRDATVTSTTRVHYADACWAAIDSTPSLCQLSALAISPIAPGPAHDLMEMVYLVRNLAVHGTLDFLDPTHNAVAQAALSILDRLVQEVT